MTKILYTSEDIEKLRESIKTGGLESMLDIVKHYDIQNPQISKLLTEFPDLVKEAIPRVQFGGPDHGLGYTSKEIEKLREDIIKGGVDAIIIIIDNENTKSHQIKKLLREFPDLLQKVKSIVKSDHNKVVKKNKELKTIPVRTKSEIDRICKKYKITNYNINSDNSVDVFGDVDLKLKKLKKLPLQFGTVHGDFKIQGNFLSYLIGCPSEIKGDFYCQENYIINLEGFPKSIGGLAYLHRNPVYTIFSTIFHNKYDKIVNNFSDKKSDNAKEFMEAYHTVYERNMKFIRYLIEFDAIREYDIVEQRLEEAYWMATKKELPISRRRLQNYNLI